MREPAKRVGCISIYLYVIIDILATNAMRAERISNPRYATHANGCVELAPSSGSYAPLVCCREQQLRSSFIVGEIELT
jgi:hypothetical protein